ncbi:hypothetical protein [Domibacillus epiphyticus]|uniref:YolD-like family protein n=1 Tax=Domibacillus epiphyticus TaxID=1714355 RepID=A0A1V2AA87_9BACI|nr:hypothetical protein [Domibacillus epiphyticus]OMP67867.1 hypothetical protein BTO28_05110 [Domibacillus epiphyticus]
MLYTDRKMGKWQGFMLSEHAEQMRDADNEKKSAFLDVHAKELFDRALIASIYDGKPIEMKMTFGEPFTVIGVVKSVNWEEGYIQISGTSEYFYLKDIVSLDFADARTAD